MEKITITLTKEALAIVDKLASKYYEKKRSPAINHILKDWGKKKK